jgi:hypothetical protein
LLGLFPAATLRGGGRVSQGSPVPADGLREAEDLAEVMKTYRRLATMDPPAMRSLIVELMRLSDESSVLAMELGSPKAVARAGRDARRVAAAQAALAAVEAEA